MPAAQRRRRRTRAGAFATAVAVVLLQSLLLLGPHAVDSHTAAGQSSAGENDSPDGADSGEPPPDGGHGHAIYCRNCGHTIGSTAAHVGIPPALAEPTLGRGTTAAPAISPDAVLHNFDVGSSSFQVATLATLDGFKLDGAYESKSTFFQGYGWTAVMCPHCNVQIGWLFEEKASRVKSKRQQKQKQKQKKKQKQKQKRGRSPTSSAKAKQQQNRKRGKHGNGDDNRQGAIQAAATGGGRHGNDGATVARTDSAKLDSLDRRCLFFPQGYWTVRFCHLHDVIQYHQTPQGDKDPIYSLGSFDTTGRVERPRTLTAGDGEFISHFYVGGQKCDETKRPRVTEVQFFCCKDKPHELRILLFSEYSKCKYRMKVCVPSMCGGDGIFGDDDVDDEADDEESDGAEEDEHGSSTAVEVDVGPGGTVDAAALINAAPQKSAGPPSADGVEAGGASVEGAAVAEGGDSSSRRPQTPQKFFALRWASVVTENSNELLWSYAAMPILALSE